MNRQGRAIEPRGISVFGRVADALIVFSTYALAHEIHGGPFSEVQVVAASIAVLAFHFMAEATGLYRGERMLPLRSEIGKITGSWLSVIFVLLLASFMLKRTEELSRISTSLWFVATPIALVLARVGSRTVLATLRRSGRHCRPTAILGATPLGGTLIEEIRRSPWLGLRIVGVFTRLWKRDGKPRYLAMIPRVWGAMERDLKHPALAPVAAWFEGNIPRELRDTGGGELQ